MRVEYDKEADAIYVYLSNKPYAYGKDLDTERRIDYDTDNKPRGIELLCVSHGVVIDDLPFAREVERLLGERDIKVYA
jgi:uncharacterized protein YuzE